MSDGPADGAVRRGRALPDPGRLLTFLDAAVAIALTLLVLPLVDRVPEAVRAGEDPATLLAGNLAPIGSFLLSFWVVWRFWTAHHQVFAAAGDEVVVGPGLLRLNLLWLVSIVVLPFVTEMVASYGSEPLVLRLYVGVLCVTSASLTAMVVLLRRGGREGPGVDSLVASLAATLGFGAALVVVLVVPAAGYWPLLVLALDFLITPLVGRVRRRVVGESA